jgi:hypothetical protein
MNSMSSVKERVIAAMREQATEAFSLRDEPTYNRYECDRTSLMFNDAADWLTDNWDDIVQGMEAL